jgi:membrane protein DedA with SNARE-associated domain
MFLAALLDQVIEFVSANARWAPYLAFVFAFLETLAFFSILVPSTAILVAVGGLVAAGSLELFPIWLGASIGALIGSTLSWWLGMRYGPQILNVWPLNKDPDAIGRSQRAFARWGPWAVFIGHFFGPFRSIVFIAAGVSAMRVARFQCVNIPGALLWAFLVPKSGEIGGSVLGYLWQTVFGA